LVRDKKPLVKMRTRRSVQPKKNGYMVTIREVGRLAGVSVATASRVLSNSGYPVSSGARDRVLDASQRLNYHPNALARSLHRNHTKTIGILVHLIVDPYLNAIATSVATAAQNAGYLPFICSTGFRTEDEEKFAKELLSHRVAGIVVIGGGHGGHEEHLDRIVRHGTPLVCVGRRNVMAPVVEPDEAGGMRAAVRHLLELGHSKIGLIAGLTSFGAALERRRGYEDAIVEAGQRDGRVALRDDWIFQGDFTTESGRQFALRFAQLKERPTAVVAANDLMALGFCKQVQKLGYRVPHDVSVIGFTDMPVAEHSNPPLTTVAIPKDQLGRLAAELLLDLVDRKFQGISNTTLPTELIVRESSAPPPR
jgi:LacI family transcriptional regulator